MFYKKEMTVIDYDCDFENRLKMSSAMRYMQQTSSEHLDSLNLPYDKLVKENMAFLLSKTCVRIFDMPVSGQNIVVGTAPICTKGARFIREFTVDDLNGNRMLSAITLWLLVDPENRKILRPSSFPYSFTFEKSMIEGEIEDIAMPKVAESDFVLSRGIDVLYSQIDHNNHVNNSMYADYVCDCLPISELTGKGLRKFAISYQNEARLGDHIKIRMAALPDNTYYVCGTKENGDPCFESRLQLEAGHNTRS